uniref:Ubiquitin-like domain-containing protein n=1 Tax=Steinernema glaseri TaxID=37863 RepID=A0A1I7YRH7_9BILA
MAQNEVYLEVVRRKAHLFISLPESSNILEVKKTVCGILKVPVEDQLLKFRKNTQDEWRDLENTQTLSECNIHSGSATAQSPAQIALVVQSEDAAIDIEPLSSPPPIPDAMRPEAAQPAADAN